MTSYVEQATFKVIDESSGPLTKIRRELARLNREAARLAQLTANRAVATARATEQSAQRQVRAIGGIERAHRDAARRMERIDIGRQLATARVEGRRRAAERAEQARAARADIQRQLNTARVEQRRRDAETQHQARLDQQARDRQLRTMRLTERFNREQAEQQRVRQEAQRLQQQAAQPIRQVPPPPPGTQAAQVAQAVGAALRQATQQFTAELAAQRQQARAQGVLERWRSRRQSDRADGVSDESASRMQRWAARVVGQRRDQQVQASASQTQSASASTVAAGQRQIAAAIAAAINQGAAAQSSQQQARGGGIGDAAITGLFAGKAAARSAARLSRSAEEKIAAIAEQQVKKSRLVEELNARHDREVARHRKIQADAQVAATKAAKSGQKADLETLNHKRRRTTWANVLAESEAKVAAAAAAVRKAETDQEVGRLRSRSRIDSIVRGQAEQQVTREQREADARPRRGVFRTAGTVGAIVAGGGVVSAVGNVRAAARDGMHSIDNARTMAKLLDYDADTKALFEKTAAERSGDYKEMQRGEILSLLNETSTNFKNPQDAVRLLPALLHSIRVQMLTGLDAKQAQDGMVQLVRGMGMAGVLAEPDGTMNLPKIMSFIDIYNRSKIVAQKDIDPRQVQQFFKYARTAGQTMNYEGLMTAFIAMTDTRGAPFGNMTDQLVKQLTGNAPGHVMKRQHAAGLIDGQYVRASNGQRVFQYTGVKDEPLLRENQFAWMWDKFMSPEGVLAKAGVDPMKASAAEIAAVISPLFGRATVQGLANQIVMQRGEWQNQLENAKRFNTSPEYVAKVAAESIHANMQQVTQQLRQSTGDLAERMTGTVLPALGGFSSALNALSRRLDPKAEGQHEENARFSPGPVVAPASVFWEWLTRPLKAGGGLARLPVQSPGPDSFTDRLTNTKRPYAEMRSAWEELKDIDRSEMARHRARLANAEANTPSGWQRFWDFWRSLNPISSAKADEVARPTLPKPAAAEPATATAAATQVAQTVTAAVPIVRSAADQIAQSVLALAGAAATPQSAAGQVELAAGSLFDRMVAAATTGGDYIGAQILAALSAGVTVNAPSSGPNLGTNPGLGR